ncbi:hypothetical protein BX600DRAFT_524842 [Xylariales sp. PMI_506]|nr:hypothetical protein BX600DRAFT_524842 [Xylariales sp. PMI_506]
MRAGTSSSARQRRNSSGIGVTPQLSCQLCRERKVKCDKLNPCTTCVMSGVECLSIYRQRLPRGRHSQQKSNNNNVENRNQHPPSTRNTSPAPQPESAAILPMNNFLPTDEPEVYAADGGSLPGEAPRANLDNREPNWPAVTSQNHVPARMHQEKRVFETPHQKAFQQAQGIQPALQSPELTVATSTGREDGGVQQNDLYSTDPREEKPGTKFPAHPSGTFGTLCFGGSTSSTPPDLVNLDISASLGRLCHVYLDQVDPVFKILHRPSLRRLLHHGSTYLGYPEGHPSRTALSSAICYVSICSLSETQCRDMFQSNKSEILNKYRWSCEIALDRADVLVTVEMTVLQAFVLYLIGRRSEGLEKAVWSLIPLAIRLAKGMSLHPNVATGPATSVRYQSESFFDLQMRKRLWLTICVLDLQTSFAHGSEPLIAVPEVSSALEGLRHLEDDDFDERTTEEVPEREELTSATLAFVTYHAQVSNRLLIYATQQQQQHQQQQQMQQQQREDINMPLSGSGSVRSHASSSVSSMYAPERGSPPVSFSLIDRRSRERISAAFDRKAFELIRFCDPEASRQAWFTWHSTQTLVASTRLAALRPLPSTFTGGESGSDLELPLAFRILEKVVLMHTDPRCEGLRWHIPIPYHALAVATAGCYACADEKMLRERWPLVEQVWQLQKARAASGGSSTYFTSIGFPLPKLVRKIREKLARNGVAGAGAGAGAGSSKKGANQNPSLKSAALDQFSPAGSNHQITFPVTIPGMTAEICLDTAATSSDGMVLGRAPSHMGSGDRGRRSAATAPSDFDSSSHYHHQSHRSQQPRESYSRSGSSSLSSGGHKLATGATNLQRPDFSLDPLPFHVHEGEDDSSVESQQDSLFDCIDLYNDDMVAMITL